MKQVNFQEPVVSFEVIGALADAMEKSPLTIQRWIEKKDIRLTCAKAIEVLERFGVRTEDLIGATQQGDVK